ncbi:dienelactone hydrolase family protein [Actinoplanes sp. TRM 88003]|uniref:Dienelactone hydrolase family protein n=1 Tax=Paractinoplanes aksuensis TaxID=2939490 RepID=A0ABT1DHP5_9ACTN|nr:dienelactone hydrolase family protein [Actinoplanes aksuensis]MCO8270013.1 dienelactone hydrolase family protein [Actinoplanes aksuensis]
MLALLALLLDGLGPARPAAAQGSVVSRLLELSRGADRPLPTTLWYPSALAGRHPIILFSHGLGGLPRHFAPLAAGWAEAGYVVAAPTYPFTNGLGRVDRRDIVNQPADAAFVIEAVRALNGVPGDVLAGHLDIDRVAAVGFSAGGTTTLGLFGPGHPAYLRAGVSISGRRPPAEFGGSPAPLLFLHGDRDRVVPIRAGRQAYASAQFPKQFVTIPGARHGEFLRPGDSRYPRVTGRILTFLGANVPVA